MKQLIVLGLVSFLSNGIGSTEARASGHLNCDAYASTAVIQQQFNLNAHCGITGGGWSTDYNGHRNWCMLDTTTMADLTRETDGRAAALQTCQGSRDQVCQAYAQGAVNRAERNVSSGCNIQDSAFDNNYQGHFDWCKSVPTAVSTGEAQRREEQLGQCLTQKLQGICAFYTASIAPLFQRQNEACAGRSDFVMSAPSPQDMNECLANADLDAVWVNQRVAAMNARIAECESNTVTYDSAFLTALYRGTPVDGCTSHPHFCGDIPARDFCRWQGHADTIGRQSGPATNFSVHVDCLIEGVAGRADQQDRCFCSGNCSTIAAITCTGRN